MPAYADRRQQSAGLGRIFRLASQSAKVSTTKIGTKGNGRRRGKPPFATMIQIAARLEAPDKSELLPVRLDRLIGE